MKKSFFALLLFAFIIGSCKKSSDNNTPVCSLSAVTLAGTYKITNVTYKANSGGTSDFTNTLFSDCQRDDNIILSTGDIVIYSDLGTKCPTDGTKTGTWTFSGSSLTISGTGTQLDGKSQAIENFTCTNFQGSYSGLSSGDKIIISYQKQ